MLNKSRAVDTGIKMEVNERLDGCVMNTNKISYSITILRTRLILFGEFGGLLIKLAQNI